LIRYTQSAIEAVDFAHTRIVVNDRADVLQCTTAYGLHVGQSDLSVSQSRSLIRPSCVLGLSTHDMSQVRVAMELAVDCIGCGPTFASNTKNFSALAGLAFLKEVAAYLQSTGSALPAFAIGGIELANLKSLLATGIKRVAVSKAIWGAESPGNAAEAFRQALDAASITASAENRGLAPGG
jgi:thiamine-phosphate pyrophosphorylase